LSLLVVEGFGQRLGECLERCCYCAVGLRRLRSYIGWCVYDVSIVVEIVDGLAGRALVFGNSR